MNASKVAEHKVSTQKSVAFLYINSEQSEKEIANAIWFAERLNRIKYLGINLIKGVKDLFSENYKTLLKEITDDIIKLKYIHCHIWKTSVLLKMLILPKVIYKLVQFPSKSNVAFAEIENPILKFMGLQRTWNSQNILEKEQLSELSMTSNLLHSYSNQSSLVLA